jgi:hypothetical protein
MAELRRSGATIVQERELHDNDLQGEDIEMQYLGIHPDLRVD